MHFRNTEERAQLAEASVSDLEFQLKDALEKIRKLEKDLEHEGDQNHGDDLNETGKSESMNCIFLINFIE